MLNVVLFHETIRAIQGRCPPKRGYVLLSREPTTLEGELYQVELMTVCAGQFSHVSEGVSPADAVLLTGLDCEPMPYVFNTSIKPNFSELAAFYERANVVRRFLYIDQQGGIIYAVSDGNPLRFCKRLLIVGEKKEVLRDSQDNHLEKVRAVRQLLSGVGQLTLADQCRR